MNFPPSDRAPRLLFLVTEDWYFWSHRLPIAIAARDQGFDVAVATRVAKHGNRITAERFRLHSLNWSRSSGLLRGIGEIVAIMRLYRTERPEILHHVSLKPVVFGSIAARFTGQRRIVNAINGLGFAFTSNSLKARMFRLVLRVAFRLFIDRPGVVILLQNDDDRRYLIERGFVRRAKVVVVRGSGVDMQYFAALPPPSTSPVTIAVVTRMLRIKGVEPLVAACRELRDRKVGHRLLLVGDVDADNPSSIGADTLRTFAAEPGVEWLGFREDVRKIWATAHIAVLTSLGGEGVPKTLIEAAACGRPIVATDVAGCREIVIDGVNGILVPVNNPTATAVALERLIRDEGLRLRLGAEGRRHAECYFADRNVVADTLAVYRELLRSRSIPGQ